MDRIVNAAPVRPSLHNRRINDEVQTIVLKCLAKEPLRRYQTAGELARDIRHYLAREPIEAKRDSSLYMLRKYVNKNRAMLAAMAAFVALLVGSSIVAWTLYASAQRARLLAETKTTEATDRLWDAYLAQAHGLRNSGHVGQRLEAIATIAKAAAIRPTEQLRDEAIACMSLIDLKPLRRWETTDPASVAFDNTLELSACGDSQGNISIRRVDNDVETAVLAGWGVPVGHMVFSRDQRRLAVLYLSSPAVEGDFAIWDLEQGRLLTRENHGCRGEALDFRPDDRVLAVGRPDGAIAVYDSDTGALARLLPAGALPWSIAFAPEADLLAIASARDNVLEIRDATSGALRHSATYQRGIRGLAWKPDGSLLAIGCDNSIIYLHDWRDGTDSMTLVGHRSAVTTVAFDRVGGLLVSSSWDGTTRFWDTSNGQQLLLCGEGRAWMNADGSRLALRAPGYQRARSPISLFEVIRNRECRTLHDGQATGSIDLSPDGRLLVSTGGTSLLLWDVANGERLQEVSGESPRAARFTPDGSCVITTSDAGLSRRLLHGVGSETRFGERELLWTAAPVSALDISRDGRTFAATFTKEDAAVVVHTAALESPVLLKGQGSNFITLNSDGTRVATGPWTGRGVRLWDAATGQVLHELDVPGAAVVVFAPDGETLAISLAEEILLWNAVDWSPIRRMSTGSVGQPPCNVAFSSDGRMLAVVGFAPVLHLFDASSLERLAAFEDSLLSSPVISRDGRLLAASDGRRIHIWDLSAVGDTLRSLGLDWKLRR